jgi:hypothetical protein
MRFAIRRSPVWKPLLVPLGGTAAGSFVDVTPERVRVRFGFLFDAEFPQAAIATASPFDYPWYGSVGWRTDFGGTLGLIGAHEGVVQLTLRTPQTMKLGPFPLKIKTLRVSLEEPDAFLAAVRPRA